MTERARITPTAAAKLAGITLLSVAAGYGLRASNRLPTIPAGTTQSTLTETPQQAEQGDSPRATSTTKSKAELIAEALHEAGGVPSVDEVFGSRGFDRYEKLALFLVNASAADCEEIYTRWNEADDLKHHCMDAILLRWAEVDPMGAIKKNGHAGLWAWGKSDPEAALAYGLENGRSGIVARAIAQTDGQRGLQLLSEHPETADHSSWGGVVTGLAKTNRRAAIEFALERDVSLDGTMKTWTSQNPDRALSFALDLDDPRHRQKALKEVLSKLEETDPARADQVINDLPPGSMREEFRRSLLSHIATTDLERAITMTESIDSAALRSGASRHLAQQIAFSDPERAIELLASTSSFPQHRSLSRDLVETLAQLRPEACLTQGIERSDIAELWVRREPEAASEWIAEQPPSIERDEMVIGLVAGITSETSEPDYASAIAWTATLETRRLDHLTKLYNQWQQANPAAARAALESDSALEELQSTHIRDDP